MKLGLSKPNPTSYNSHMADQTIAKPLGLIKDLRILVHEIPYTINLNVIESIFLDFSHSMSLGCPWLRDAKVSHGWGKNIIIIQGMRIV